MADPLSVVASVAGVISLGIQVTQSLVDYYNTYRRLDSDLIRTTRRLECLLEAFSCLERTLRDRSFQEDERDLIKNIETSIKACDEIITELQDEYNKFEHTSSSRFRSALTVAGRQALYPFRKSTLLKLDEDINEIQKNLSFALDVLNLKDNKKVQDDITEIKSGLVLARTSQQSSNLRSWLKAPDATIEHNDACSKKCTDTGLWLISDPRFTKWFKEENSMLWLNGFAGSGKSVLCSTAIQHVFDHQRSNPRIGIAFFYFTFNDESKRDESAMLRALLLQLSEQLQDDHAELLQLQKMHKSSTAPSGVLIQCLRRLIEKFQDVFITLDALDESPRERPRGRVLDALKTMHNWGLQGLHLFTTSRDEPDIREYLEISANQQIAMRNLGIDEDIANFISARLDEEPLCWKWKNYRDLIQETLSRRAKGIFRWVECQLMSLKSWPCSHNHLTKLLSSLPQSLDETYERMLCNIDQRLVEDARRILTLLCFAYRPLTVRELIDGIAVGINEPTRLCKDCRLADYNDIHNICPGFIEISLTDDNVSTVKIAHFSVQEYLVSDRIRQQKAAVFGLSTITAHAEMTQICVIYLLGLNFSRNRIDRNTYEEYPLGTYAGRFWYHHYRCAENLGFKLDHLVLELFQQKGWYMNDSDHLPSESYNLNWYPNKNLYTLKDHPGPVYFASCLGFDSILNDLLRSRRMWSSENSTEISASYLGALRLNDTPRRRYGSPLQAASSEGHERVVRLLLENGVNVNSQGGECGNALIAASWYGHQGIIQLLLDRGADINNSGAHKINALTCAAFNGHEKIVQLLLARGANLGMPHERGVNALQAASFAGYEAIVRIFLSIELDSNIPDLYEDALRVASYRGHKAVVQQLLDRGTDVNFPLKRTGARCRRHHHKVMWKLSRSC